MKLHKIFEDTPTVDFGRRTKLKVAGLLNPNGTVIGWRKLAPWLRDRNLKPIEAKSLILIELETKQRGDTLKRLINYLGIYEREKVMGRVNQYLEKGSTNAR